MPWVWFYPGLYAAGQKEEEKKKKKKKKKREERAMLLRANLTGVGIFGGTTLGSILYVR